MPDNTSDRVKVHYDEEDGWSIPAKDLENLVEKKQPKPIAKAHKKDIPPKKFLFGILVLATFVTLGIFVPESRILLAFLAIFGFGSFLDWLSQE